jgi:AraC-like DNA-binding protein
LVGGPAEKTTGATRVKPQKSTLKDLFGGSLPEKIAVEADYDARRVAALCNISTRQLERYFQSTLSCTPQRWLNELKVLKAQELLLAGRSVKETSKDLGYRHASYFCYQFKSISGATPKSFLLRARR